MKKLILILFVIVSISAQDENKGQSIELPDFVITGKQSITLPTMKKVRPDLVPILSHDFFYPSFTPEDFTFSSVTMPDKPAVNLLPAPSGYNAQLILGAGQYTLPTGEFHFGKSFDSGEFYSKLWGSNTTDYEPYADYNVSGIQLSTSFFVDRNAKTLPGLKVGADAYFIREGYYLFQDYISPQEREAQQGGVTISFDNQFNEYVKYGLNLNGNYLQLKKYDDLKSMDYSADAYARFITPATDFIIDGKVQMYRLDYGASGDDETLNYYDAGGAILFKIAPEIYAKVGAKYYSSDYIDEDDPGVEKNDNMIAPMAEVGMRLSDQLSLSAGYRSYAEFYTVRELLNENKYLYAVSSSSLSTLSNQGVFEKYKMTFKLNLKYAYDKYYEVNVGGEFAKIDNYHYYLQYGSLDDPIVTYRDIAYGTETQDDVSRLRLYAEGLFHLGPFGWFYGSAEYRDVKFTRDGSDYLLPYEPKFSADLNYGYNFDFGLSVKAGVEYRRDIRYFETLTSSDEYKLDDYINLTAGLRYALAPNFDLTLTASNLLNRDNYLWRGYIEKPFDFIAGIDYRF